MGHDGLVTPRCIGCGDDPVMLLSEQAFCGNDRCRVLTWNPTKTVDENLDALNTVRLPEWLSG